MKKQSGNGGAIFNRRWKRGNVDVGVKEGGDEVKDGGVMVEVWDWWMKSIEMEGKREAVRRGGGRSAGFLLTRLSSRK